MAAEVTIEGSDNDISDVITKTITEQKKYDDIIIDTKIAAALATLQSGQTMQLGTVDNGQPNAIWIDTTS